MAERLLGTVALRSGLRCGLRRALRRALRQAVAPAAGDEHGAVWRLADDRYQCADAGCFRCHRCVVLEEVLVGS